MTPRFNRRDFLKLAGLLPLSIAAPRFMRRPGVSRLRDERKQNVLVIVFDAFSAYHVSMYGYQRATTPNLARLAEQAVVYHNHYAGGSFTTPGTASLLTGTLPWTHRAFQPKATVAEPFVTRNLFGAFQDYYRIAYTHNGWANILLEQCRDELDELIPWKKLFLRSYDAFLETLFEKDSDIASVAWTRNVDIGQGGYSYSLFLSHLYQALQENRIADLKQLFPRGLPSTGFVGSDFLLENAVDWIGNRLPLLPQPFIGYFHFLPPHGPYNTSLEFYDKFSRDGLTVVAKPEDLFSEGVPDKALMRMRAEYDEFLLYVDKEFGRLFDDLERSGLRGNTWVVVTSDHGELFERGINGHSTDALYQPLVRIPLLVFEPGRTTGVDIRTSTSAVDVLPTLAKVTGQSLPDWTEGVPLPPYADLAPDPDRNIYVVRANKNAPNQPLTRSTLVMVKGRYKLLYFFGYKDRGIDELVKLYDVETDPEELVDLYSSLKDIAEGLLRELKVKLAEVNQPYL